jgi:integrase
MARPTLRKGSTYIQYDRRIPKTVLDRVRGQKLLIPVGEEAVEKRISETAFHIKLSLRTDDKAEGKLRHAQVDEYLERVYAGLLTDTQVKLNHRECFAVAGVFYKGWLRDRERRPMKVFQKNEDGTRTTRFIEGSPIEVAYAALADDPDVDPLDPDLPALKGRLIAFLRDWGIKADAATLEMLMKVAFPPTLKQAYEQTQRETLGDYRPDPNADRFPPFSEVSDKHSPKPGGMVRGKSERLTLTELFARWKDSPDQRGDAKSPGIAQSTIASYSTVFHQLGDFLKHEDVWRITRDDLEGYLKKRREDGISHKTVVGVDRAAIRSIFKWAAENRIIQDNPAATLWKPKARKQARTRGARVFTDDEAQAILTHASHYEPKLGSREARKLTEAKRWVPWLMAYTGLRVGELAQLRKHDITERRAHWAMTIDFNAGTTKSKGTWYVPMHPHLVELGFLDFVKRSRDGYLFIDPTPERYKADAPESRTKDRRGVLGPLKTLQNDLAEFAREVVKRETVQPNHGWRHTFISMCRTVGIDPETQRAFHDHAGETVSESEYGVFYPAMVKALEKMPRYEVKPLGTR